MHIENCVILFIDVAFFGKRRYIYCVLVFLFVLFKILKILKIRKIEKEKKVSLSRMLFL